MKMEEKPPLGLMPKYIWELKRIEQIQLAITRFTEAKRAIPSEWIEEYNTLYISLKEDGHI